MPKKKLWFRARDYGWGWRPCTWQGWLVIGIYLFGVVLMVSRLSKIPEEDIGFIKDIALPLTFLTIPLIVVSYKKGEKPEWRWGGKSLSKK